MAERSSSVEFSSSKFFDSFSEKFDTIYDEKRNFFMRWLDRRFRSDMFTRFDLTFRALGDLEGKSVLDIGCGSGPYVVEALKRGASLVTAVDPAPGMLALVRNKLEAAGFSDKCSLVKGSFPEVALRPHDHAVIMGVLDYVADPHVFLCNLRPLIKVSVVASFPSQHWFRTPFRKFRYRLRRCPVFFYDQADIKEVCSAAGFSGVEIQKISGAGMDYHVCLKP